MVYQILWYLPARDLKTIRLVNKLLSQTGKKNLFWSDLCRLKWSEKLCLTTLPLPCPTIPDLETSSEMDTSDSSDDLDTVQDTPTYLRAMTNFLDHTFDELKPHSLWELAHYFPAFTVVEGSWMRAYNLIERHLEISYLHSVVRKDPFAVSDTQWELYHPQNPPEPGGLVPPPLTPIPLDFLFFFPNKISIPPSHIQLSPSIPFPVLHAPCTFSQVSNYPSSLIPNSCLLGTSSFC